ncbi:MAG: YbaY family lipoprotein [Acidobacteriota bacterium]
MKLTIELFATGDGPRAGASVIVQVRDAGLADASSTTVAEKRRTWRVGKPLRVQFDLEEASESLIVWAHVDVDGDGEVSKGDYITMQSYPVRDEGAMRVEVRRV